MTPAARRPRPRARQRALQALTASTAALLAGGLALGATGADDRGTAAAGTVVVAGHHGVPAPATAAGELVPGEGAAGAPGPAALEAHDHGELEVTVMLGAEGTTTVRGPVDPGAYFSLVNHTDADQLLTTPDGRVTADVPLRRLVTLQAPTAPGTYRLVSTTDASVSAELVVAAPAA